MLPRLAIRLPASALGVILSLAALMPSLALAHARPDRPWEHSRPAKSWAPRASRTPLPDSIASPSSVDGAVAGTDIPISQIAAWIDDVGKFAESPEIYELAIAAVRGVAGPQHPLLGHLHVRFARFLFGKSARATAQEHAAGDPRRRARALPWRGGAHQATRAVDTSITDPLRARSLSEAIAGEKILRETIRLDLRHLGDDDARRLALGRESALDLILTLAANAAGPRDIAQAWDAYLRSRAVVLDELATRQQAVAASGDSALTRLAQALNEARSRLEALSFAPLRDADRPAARIAEARDDVSRLETALARHSESFRRRMQDRAVGLADVLSGLAHDEGLVAFAYYRDLTPEPDQRGVPAWRRVAAQNPDSLRVLAFVLSPGSSTPLALPLGPALSLDTLTERWRALVSRGTALRHDAAIDSAANAAGDSLRRRVWDPIEPLVRGARRVYLVMDGALQLVNLAALPAIDRRGSYVIEHAPAFAYLGAERDLARATRAIAGNGLLAMGGVDFGGPPDVSPDRASETLPGISCRGLRNLHFRSLPDTKYEIEYVAEQWRHAPDSNSARHGECMTLVGAAASELAFRSSARGRDALHVATHGFFLRDTCASKRRPSGVSDRAGELIPPSDSSSSPLLDSGIAFAGANDRKSNDSPQNDGILTAEEIASLDLSSVRWVVLSACETALGETATREGVLGLRRAFVIAGAGTVISSLWSVNDRATMKFMAQLYYYRFSRGQSAPEAVRDAALWMLRLKRASGGSTLPADWGAFLAVDSWTERADQSAHVNQRR